MTTKAFTTTISLLLLCGLVSGQGTWTQKADFGGGIRWETVGFSIGSKGYFSLGGTSPFEDHSKDLWEYDNDTWTKKADLPAAGRSETISFTIGDKAYVGCGQGYPSTEDFWEYNPSTDTWTEKTFWGFYLQDHTAFSIGNKGYVCGGWGNQHCRNDLMEYDPTNDTWTQKADFPECRTAAVAFTIGDFAYVGTGVDSLAEATGTKEFWKYDQANDTWSQIADFGGIARREAVAFTIDNKGYVGTGVTNEGGIQYFKDFWEYNPLTDTWTQVADLPVGGRCIAGSFAIGDKGYVGTGEDYPDNVLDDLWEYCPTCIPVGVNERGNHSNISIFPNPFTTQTTLHTDKVLNDAILTLYNALGQQVRQVNNISGQTLTLQRDNLPSGLYYLQLTEDNQTIATDKLVITD